MFLDQFTSDFYSDSAFFSLSEKYYSFKDSLLFCSCNLSYIIIFRKQTVLGSLNDSCFSSDLLFVVLFGQFHQFL